MIKNINDDKKTRINVLISTLKNRVGNLLNENFPEHPGVSYIVSHQTANYNCHGDTHFLHRNDVRWLKHESTGLSKNRNFSLLHLEADIGVISDDDVEYTVENFVSIFRAFNENPEADIITFRVKCKDENFCFKNYASNKFNHTTWSLLKVSSVEIAIRKSFLDKHKLLFDEEFGLGGKFSCGEECVFLVNAKKLGAKIIYVPEYICTHPYETSQRNKSLTNDVGKINGAIFAKIWGRLSYTLLFFSMLKNITKFETPYSAFNFFWFSIKGAKEILSTSRRKFI